MIPLMYRPLEFYEFNQIHLDGFPDEKNPFAPPLFQGAGIRGCSSSSAVSRQ